MTRVAEEDEKAGRQEGKGAVGAATLRRPSAAALRLCAPAAGGDSALQLGAEFPHTGGGKAFHGDGVKDRVRLHLPAGITEDPALPGKRAAD